MSYLHDQVIVLGSHMVLSSIQQHPDDDHYCRDCCAYSRGKKVDDPSWHDDDCHVAKMLGYVLEKRARDKEGKEGKAEANLPDMNFAVMLAEGALEKVSERTPELDAALKALVGDRYHELVVEMAKRFITDHRIANEPDPDVMDGTLP